MREHIGHHVVLAERAQGAVAALRLVVLAAAVTVVDEQHRAIAHATRHRL